MAYDFRFFWATLPKQIFLGKAALMRRDAEVCTPFLERLQSGNLRSILVSWFRAQNGLKGHHENHEIRLGFSRVQAWETFDF